MLRRVLVVLSLLALILAAVSPALADDQSETSAQNTTPFHGKAFQATIVTAGSDNWVVKSDKFDADQTVEVTDATFFWPGVKKDTVTAAMFAAGDRVVIQLKDKPDGTSPLVARAVHLIPGQVFIHFTGVLTDVNDNTSITVKGAQEEKTFTVSDNTVIRSGSQTKTLATFGGAALHDDWIGHMVTVVARAENNTATAVVLHPSKGLDQDEEDVNNDADQGKGKSEEHGKASAPGLNKTANQPAQDEDIDEEESQGQAPDHAKALKTMPSKAKAKGLNRQDTEDEDQAED